LFQTILALYLTLCLPRVVLTEDYSNLLLFEHSTYELNCLQ